MLIVQKFGGTSLGNVRRLQKAAEKTKTLWEKGIRVVTVVSAQADTTDVLLCRARQMGKAPSCRELDAYLATGEQMSAALLAMALGELCVPAVSLTGWQAGIHTYGDFGNARIRCVEPDRILRELAQGRVVVVAGFQGVDSNGNVTTLGRGGSDTTAVALAGALKADRCLIYTDVDGVYDRDPRKCPNAHRYERIGYDEMLSLAKGGAQVLHDRCVEIAKQQKIPLEVLSAFADGPGTLVTEL